MPPLKEKGDKGDWVKGLNVFSSATLRGLRSRCPRRAVPHAPTSCGARGIRKELETEWKMPLFYYTLGFHIHETVTRRMCAYQQTPTCLGESIGRLTMTTHVSHVFQSRLVRNKTDVLISIHLFPLSRFSVTLWGESRSFITSLIDAQQLKISNLHRLFHPKCWVSVD